MFGWLRRKDHRDRDIGKEIEHHLAMLAKESGGSPDEAQFAARRKLGNATQIRETTRSVWIQVWFETVYQDLKYGVRTLRRTPGFTAAAVLSLALGIGANTALFQLLNALVLRSLPVANPQNLVRLDYLGSPGRSGTFWDSPNDFTNPQWEQIRAHQGPFSGMFAWANTQFNLAPRGEVHYARGLYVSGAFFQVLGIGAESGRVFSQDDDQRGCAARAVVSDGFWRREFEGGSAIGRELKLNGHPVEVIGVAHQGFTGIDVGKGFDIAVPICAQRVVDGYDVLDHRANWWLGIMGRLRPGVSIQRASAYLSSVWPNVLRTTVDPIWRQDTVNKYQQLRIHAETGRTGFSRLRRETENPLLLLFSIAALVLLIACANLANLLLARAAARTGEISVRLAIGASRTRVIRQLLSESLLLALAGSAIAVGLAQIVSGYLLSSFAASNEPLFLDLSFGRSTLAFVGIVATVACLLFGVAPALRATDRDLSSAARGSRGNVTHTRGQFGLQNLLVISQISLSLVLLVGSFLFVRSFRNLMTLDPGFREDGLLVTWVTFNDETTRPEERLPLFRRMLDQIRDKPGIESAAIVDHPPISSSYSNDTITMDGADSRQATKVLSNFNRVSDGYFRTMDTPLLAGRDFNAHDTSSGPPVAIVDEMFAARFLNGQNPIGKSFHLEAGPGEAVRHYQIVGLVKSTRYADLQDPLFPTAFFAAYQDPHPSLYTRFVVRSNLALTPTISTVRTALENVDSHAALEFRAMPALIRDSVRREDILAKVSGLLGLLAVVLATVGLYGVISYVVAQRRNEIGIRMAIGASRPEILRMIFRKSGILLAIGLACGTVLSIAGAQTAKTLLFNLAPDDPGTIILAVSALTLMTALATLIPARRAADLDPMIALREE